MINVRSDFFKGFFWSLAGTIVVSTNFVTAKYGLEGFNVETFSLVWTSAAAVYSLFIVLAMGYREQLALPGYTISKIVLLGLVTGAGMLLFWAGLAQLDPLFAAFISRFTPILTILLSAVFLGERLMVRELSPAVLMVLGSLLSAIGQWHIVGIGMILILLSCCSGAIQNLMAKMVVNAVHPNVLVFYRVGIGALVIALWTLSVGKANFDVQLPYWSATLLGAFLGPCASHLLTYRAFRYWGLSRATLVMTVQPLFILPMAYLAFGKLPTQKELLGGFMILAGAFWFTWIHFMKGTQLRT